MAFIASVAQLAGLALLSALILSNIIGLSRNIVKAKASGLPYVVMPFYPMGPAWNILQPLLLPLMQSLPKQWTERWLFPLLANQAWHNERQTFERIGANTFVAASPGGCLFLTCDPKVSQQVYREGAFDKPTELLELLNAFGPALTANAGAKGRLYRKTAAPFFGEQNMRNIWAASIQGGRFLTDALTTQAAAHTKLREIMTKYTLCLLGSLAFGKEPDYEKELRFQEVIPSGHELSYNEAVIQASDNLMAYIAVPPPLLSRVNKPAFVARNELFKYMAEMKAAKESQLQTEPTVKISQTSGLLDLLVGAFLSSKKTGEHEFSAEAVFGNIFIFNLAGFESSANTLAFSVSVLACRPAIQEAVHADLTRILGDTPMEQWSYEQHFNPLMNSMVGAVIFEILRLYPVLPWIPRTTPADGPPVPILLDGQTYHVPPGALCLMNISATHRNPDYWSVYTPDAGPAVVSDEEYREVQPFPLSNFNPYRWLVLDEKTGSRSLLTPEPGAFLTFSDGGRGCLGRRFAVIEMIAVLATLMKDHSVELIVEPGSTPEKTLRKAEWMISGGVKFGHSLRAENSVPVKFTRRT